MTSKGKVLIIDDDADLLEELYEILSCSDYRVVTCSDAGAAADAARISSPDVILIDLLMPERNGLEVIDELKAEEETAHIPFIITSGRCDEHDGCKLARINGFAGFVAKPIDPIALIEEIQKHIGEAAHQAL